MKTHPFLLSTRRLTVATAALTLVTAGAQPEDKPAVTETETKTETTVEAVAGEIATGRVFSVEPTNLLVTPANVTIPLTFAYNTKTPLMDEADKAVPWDQIRAGLPVTVHYDMNGEKMIATKVIVTRKMLTGGETTEPGEAAKKREMLAEIKKQKTIEASEKAKALPASGGGTIMGFEQVITVRAPDSTDVVQYVVNNSTLYVDSAGQPVPLQFVRTGVPVSIQYVEDAGRRIATQFVVERIPRGARESTTATGTRNGNSTGITGRTTTTGEISNTAVDQNGNSLPGVLEDGFVNPPVTVLPGSNQPGTQAGANPNTQKPNQPQPNQPQPNQPQPNQPQPNQPGATPNTPQPNAPQPGTTQPGTQPPGTRQPGSKPGATPGTQPKGTSGTELPAAAPARRPEVLRPRPVNADS